MACGRIAFKELDIPVEYHAWEIDKYAVKLATSNFPDILEHGDVFKEDFTKYSGGEDVDWVIGGSPCTYWSIAQSPDKRETTASGIGWELFNQYVRAIKETKPKFFLYENNKSMSDAIRKSISDTFGFEPILINSALVSAQNRNRLYWVGIRNEDGTYRKADISQPDDLGIHLRDILDGNIPLFAGSIKGRQNEMGWEQHLEVDSDPLKTNCLTTVDKDNVAVESVCLRMVRTEEGKELRKAYEAGEIHHGYNEYRRPDIREDGKTNTLTTVQKDNIIIQPSKGSQCFVLPNLKGEQKPMLSTTVYSVDKKGGCLMASTGGRGYMVSEPLNPTAAEPINTTEDGKAHTLRATCYKDGQRNLIGNNYDHRTASAESVSSETAGAYQVSNGQITYKGKKYPIKLADGWYRIRKLSVDECKRLQTVPDWYDMNHISKTQAYKCLGNGWTIRVITHLIAGVLEQKKEESK